MINDPPNICVKGIFLLASHTFSLVYQQMYSLLEFLPFINIQVDETITVFIRSLETP